MQGVIKLGGAPQLVAEMQVVNDGSNPGVGAGGKPASAAETLNPVDKMKLRTEQSAKLKMKKA